MNRSATKHHFDTRETFFASRLQHYLNLEFQQIENKNTQPKMQGETHLLGVDKCPNVLPKRARRTSNRPTTARRATCERFQRHIEAGHQDEVPFLSFAWAAKRQGDPPLNCNFGMKVSLFGEVAGCTKVLPGNLEAKNKCFPIT